MLSHLYRVRQCFAADPRIGDIDQAVRQAIESTGVFERLSPGVSVAITAGSRGIRNLPDILRATGEAFRRMGARPFLITAMGSHGGGTSEGQLHVLAELGVTEDSTGMPVRSTMQTHEVGRTPAGMPVYLDSIARAADSIWIVNRVKKHTDFHGPLESGLCKMMALGLGKVRQAQLIHAHRPGDFPSAIESLARVLIDTRRILGGLAIIENRRGDTAALHGVPSQHIPDREKLLLQESYRFFPKLPFDEADVLIVRRMGKNISGAGMDPNVLGRLYIEGEPEPEKPFIQLVGVLDLTPETDGNAAGVGLADLTTRRLARSIDFPKTHLNTLTSNFLQRGKIPITLENDRELLETALGSVQGAFRARPRVAVIEDTLHLESLLVSESLLESLPSDGVSVLDRLPLEFDREGNLPACND
ncbi:MAG: DUF2088 domain-containing protein [Planctomycetes bacterium]|nr:DUF2088 domain-containing protein [Planctomycetota bacterium]